MERCGLSRKGSHKSRVRPRGKQRVRLRPVLDQEGDIWELLHPRCAVDRAMDLEEVEEMIRAGETDIAIEELRWLLSGCSDFIHAHQLLGELALELGDVPLARGHFGHAFRVGAAAIRKAGGAKKVPYAQESNRHFLECGKGLIHCLKQLGKKKMAREIASQLLSCDPTDPLQIRQLVAI